MEISIKWSMCRTCTSDKGSSLLSIFQSDAVKHLKNYAGLVVDEDDGLPDQICTRCLESLEEVHRFISDCKSSELQLRDLVNQTMSSAVSFQTKDAAIGQRKRARKQHISERLPGEQPVVTKLEPSDTADNVKAATPQEEPTEKYFSAVSEGIEAEKPEILEEYTISDIVEVLSEGQDIETASQTSATALNIEKVPCEPDTSEENSSTQKSESGEDYKIDLGVACEPERHICQVCSNSYPNASQLTAHLRTHRNARSYQCEVCQKLFSAACNLTSHMRTHTGEKPFECGFCQRRFTDRSTHRKHERMHTNERPYICGTCGKAFSLSTSLKAHALSHTNEKAHKCVTCNKAFRLRHQLKAHEKTHVHRQEMGLKIIHQEYDRLVSS
ncbi:hypothetical protein KR018_009859 [Drosophila ironensis]|nr:hypothetical protein KR018_009859 [Drosophila ironensis]